MLPITPFIQKKQNKTRKPTRAVPPTVSVQPAPVLVARPMNTAPNLPNIPEFNLNKYQDTQQQITDAYFRILQKAVNQIEEQQQLPSQQPLPLIGLTPQQITTKLVQEAAKLQPPSPLDLSAAEAQAAAEAIQKAGEPPFVPPAQLGQMPETPKPPAAKLPPQFQLNTKPNVANFMAAFLGLFKPQAAGQFASAAIEGNVAEQQADFERRRQYWQDTVKAEQTAYENAVNQYNAEMNRFLTKYQADDKYQDIARQYQQLKYSQKVGADEKRNLATILKSLADRHAEAQTAKAKAEAAQKVLEIIDKPHIEQQQLWKNWVPAIATNLYNLLSESRRWAEIQLGTARHALSQERLALMADNIQSLMRSREFNNMLKAAGLKINQDQVMATIMNAIGVQARDQANMLFLNMPADVQIKLNAAFSKLQQADQLEQRINDPEADAIVLSKNPNEPIQLTAKGLALKKRAEDLRKEAMEIYVANFKYVQQAMKQPSIPAGPFQFTPRIDPSRFLTPLTLPKLPGQP